MSEKFDIENYLELQINEIQSQVRAEKVMLALSGGVDSSVCAALLSKAIPGQLSCVFVDTGFMRLNEGNEVEQIFKNMDLEFIRVNAEERFIAKLKGVTDPEEKRKIVGKEFITVFREEANVTAIVEFFPVEGSSTGQRAGRYSADVVYRRATGGFGIIGKVWIDEPEGWIFANFSGTISGNMFSGTVNESSNTFSVNRI
jgi:hypothetical protein